MAISVDQDDDEDEDDGDEGATARGWRAEGALWFPVKSQRKSRSAEAAANHPEGTLHSVKKGGVENGDEG